MGASEQARRAGDAARSRRRVTSPARALIAGVRVYQATLSPLIGRHCRFLPTCSNYAIDALRSHGAFRGGWLATRRVLRCHPLGGFGYDPVPPPDDEASRRPASPDS